MIAIIFLLVLLVGGILVNKFIFKNEEIRDSPSVACQIDSDCLPKEACHPKTCVNEKFAENKEGKICSAVCEPGSLDCGQGFCSCINNKCNVVFK